MKFTLSKTYSFDAAHELPEHKGKCKNLHGHTYSLLITLSANDVHGDGAQRGMLIDYGELDRIVKPFIERLDHKHLNTIPGFSYPTAELIAQRLYYDLRRLLADGFALRVAVSETPKTSASYGDDI